jgi:hypothetical protein
MTNQLKPDCRGGNSQEWHFWGLEAQGIPLDVGVPSREGFPDLPFVRNPTAEEVAGLNAHTRPDLDKKIRDYKKLVADISADIQAEEEAKRARKAARRLARQAAVNGKENGDIYNTPGGNHETR